MTQVGKMLMDEGHKEGLKEGDYARAKKTAITMLKRNTPCEEVAEILEFPVSIIQDWKKELCVTIEWN